MALYDPREEETYGVAGADFPVTFYDRPQLAFANLLRGDIDGVTRAMLSPSTLSPSQIQSVRSMLLKGKKPNPLLKTITDIATNPLVIAGLILSLKYPIGSTNALLKLRKGLLPKAATMNELFSGMHDVMMNTRTIPGMFENLHGVLIKAGNFVYKHAEAAGKLLLEAGSQKALSETDMLLVAARLDGLHKTENFMVRTLKDSPEWLAFFGKSDVPIAPNIQKAMEPRLISLSDRLRSWFDNVRKEITTSPEGQKRISQALERKGLNAGEDIADYFPHVGNYNKYRLASIRGTTGVQYRKYLHEEIWEKVSGREVERLEGMIANLDDLRKLESTGAIKAGFVDQVARPVYQRRAAEAGETIRGIWNDITKLGLNDTQNRLEFVRRVNEYYTKGPGKNLNYVGRLGGKNAAKDTLDAMAGALQDAKFRGASAVDNELLEIGRVLAEPAQYSLNLTDTLSKYTNSTAATYGWYITGHGDKIKEIVQTPGIFRDAPYLESYLMDDIIPMVRQEKTWPQLHRSLSFSTQKEKIFNWLKVSPFVEQTVGTKGKDWLLKYFARAPGSASAEGLGGQIAQYFHLSALGANLSPASQNSLQNFLTTIHVVGPQGIYRGLMGVPGHDGLLKKLGDYIGQRLSGVDATTAYRAVFHEYVKDMGTASQFVDSMLAREYGMGALDVFKKPGWWDKTKTALMMPFRTSEAGNLLLAYYSGRNQHIFGNMAKAAGNAAMKAQLIEEAGQVGQTLTMMTQFTGGPLGVPKALLNVWPPLKQFVHFPLRFMGFLQASGRLGPDPNIRNWGTIGRVLLGSTAGYLTARDLFGIDLSKGLLTGALPVSSYEESPFYPFPFVPPVVGLGGSAVKALLTGSTEQLGSAASMLIPGGIAARRLYKSLSPRFADYSNPTPEGRIPLYNNEQALVGTMSPWQLTLRSLGLRTIDPVAEQFAAKWMLSQRDRIRGYRRDYIQALFENDIRKADSVNNEFRKHYPELGPLQIKRSDVTALENRREISRLNRIAKGLPTAYRPLFERVIGEASFAQITRDIEAGSLGMVPSQINSQLR